MLEHIDDSYQKTEGFPTYDLTRGEAFAILELWKKAEEIEWKQNVDNLTGDELTRVCFQRKGTQRKLATKAVCNLRIVDGTGTIHAGDLFESETGIQYESLETKDVEKNSVIKIRCMQAGSIGNVPKGTITQMPITIAGINNVINDDAAINGEDEETDDDLRERYYEELREPQLAVTITTINSGRKKSKGLVRLMSSGYGMATIQLKLSSLILIESLLIVI
jgi:hypothetical protein